MTSLSRSTIDQWLAKVEVPPALPRPPAPSHADTLGNQGFNQRDERTPQVHADPPSNTPIITTPPIHDQRGAYERRLRHKTKPHRYEYKSKSSTRRSSTNRKHTINDNFQAPNVSKARLTLPAHINSGIFQKGKTSSPVKCRRSMPGLITPGCLPGYQLTTMLAFSETDFLHKRLQHTTDGKQEQDEAGASRPPTERPPSVRTFQSFLYQSADSHVEAATDLHRSKSAFQLRSQSSIRDLDRNNHTAMQDPGHENDDTEDLRKADELREAYTDRLLLFGPMPESMTFGTERNYKSLEELKAILEERMKTWHFTTQAPADSETRTEGTHRRKRSSLSPLDSEVMGHPAPKTRKCSHLRSCERISSELQISDRHELCSRLKTPTASEPIARASEPQSDLSWSATPRNRASSQIVKIAIASEPQNNTNYQPSMQSELEIDGLNNASHVGHSIALDSTDSEALFAQTLDAAYNVIVNGTHYFPESYVRNTLCTVGPSETIAGATNRPYDGELPERLLLAQEGVNHRVESQNRWPELQWPTRDPWREHVERLSSNALDGVDAVKTDLEDGRLKGFWRRNKLY